MRTVRRRADEAIEQLGGAFELFLELAHGEGIFRHARRRRTQEAIRHDERHHRQLAAALGSGNRRQRRPRFLQIAHAVIGETQTVAGNVDLRIFGILVDDVLQSLDRFLPQRCENLGALGRLGVVLGGQRAEVTALRVAEQDFRKQRALRVCVLKALRGFVGLVVIAGQVMRRHQPLRDLLFAVGQQFLRDDLLVGGGGFLGLFERLLRVGQVEQDFAAALTRFGIGADHLLGPFGGRAIGVERPL